MEYNLFNQKVENVKNGKFIYMVWCSYPQGTKEYKQYNGRIQKVTSGVVRLGIDYSHLAENVGKPTGHLKSGYWKTRNLVIENVDKNEMVSLKLRVYPTKNKKHKSKTKWYFDGVEVTKEWLIDNHYMKEPTPRTEPLICFDIKVENIIQLGK